MSDSELSENKIQELRDAFERGDFNVEIFRGLMNVLIYEGVNPHNLLKLFREEAEAAGIDWSSIESSVLQVIQEERDFHRISEESKLRFHGRLQAAIIREYEALLDLAHAGTVREERIPSIIAASLSFMGDYAQEDIISKIIKHSARHQADTE